MTTTMVPLGDISQQIRGVTYKKADAKPVAAEGYEMLLRANNITDNGLILEDVVHVPAAKVSRKQLLLEHDVVIAASSGSLKVVGKSASFGGGPRVTFGAFCKAIRPDTTKVDPRYFSHAFRTIDYRRHVEKRAAGANINNLRNEDIDDYEIPLPPLEEQRRIAGILDAADALRRRRREALALLDTLPGAIFAEMFVDPVEKSQARKFVPLGAITSKIGSGATPRGGAKVYRDEGTKFIRSMNVRDGTFSEEGMVCIDEKAARQLSNVEVTKDDVFLNITGASVARCCRSDASLSGARVNQHVAIIRPQNSVFTDFIMGALCHPHMNANLLRIAEAGATRQAITKSEIERLEVPAPTENEAGEYSRRLRVAKGMREQVSDHQSQLETLFASLQSRAFAGDL